jgi:hypothetical protein
VREALLERGKEGHINVSKKEMYPIISLAQSHLPMEK